MTLPGDLDPLVARNARAVRRGDSAADIVLAILFGVIASVALVHWCGWLL